MVEKIPISKLIKEFKKLSPEEQEKQTKELIDPDVRKGRDIDREDTKLQKQKEEAESEEDKKKIEEAKLKLIEADAKRLDEIGRESRFSQ